MTARPPRATAATLRRSRAIPRCGSSAGLARQHLQADVIGAGVVMRLHARARRRRSSPQATIASTRRSLPPLATSASVKPSALQVAHVVRQPEVHRHVPGGRSARAVDGSVSRQTICSGASSFPGPRICARLRGVLGRNEVGMRAPGALARRAPGSSDAIDASTRRRRLRRRRRHERRSVHRVEIAAQERERLLVRVPAHAGDERRVRHAHAEQEAVRDTPRRASSAPPPSPSRRAPRRWRCPSRRSSRSVPASSSAECVNASRPSASGIQSALKPSRSTSRAASCATAAGKMSRKCQMPTRPRSMRSRYPGRAAEPSAPTRGSCPNRSCRRGRAMRA